MRVPRSDRGLFIVPTGCISQAHKLWGRGMTRFRAVVDVNDPAVLYVEKHDCCGADNYELRKTGQGLHGIPATALLQRHRLQKWAPEPTTGTTSPRKAHEEKESA